MRKLPATVVLCLWAASAGGCLAGPQQLQRSVDDWDRKTYVNSPWFAASLWIVPVVPLAKVGAFVVDVTIGNAYAFWWHDTWDGKGTGFEPARVEPTDGRTDSLLSEQGGFLKVRD
jgi:hypothetical protein